ncbi:MAG: dihydropteroate synthase [Ignavibacteriales bacterium]|nr:dihydropteroate synthase [Ignavibacteriales bacterium]
MFAQVVNISLSNVLEKYKNFYVLDNECLRDKIALEIHYENKEKNLIDLIAKFLGTQIFKFNANKNFNKVLLINSKENIKLILNRLNSNNEKFEILNVTYENYERIKLEHHYSINNKVLSFFKSLVMGILNVTPDSFYDGGKYSDVEIAFKHAVEMIESGANIIDIGGESSRPGANQISLEEELRRTIPIIKLLREYSKDIFISIDTVKSEVAREALLNGADIINDISGFNFDIRMRSVVKEFNVPYVLMHIKGNPGNMQENPGYDNVVSEIYEYFYNKIEELNSIGFNKIIIDPGIGFGKRMQDNYEIIQRLDEFKGLGYPIAVGLSNKSLIGKPLELKINERTNATTSLETTCLSKGVNIIRTHNVKNTVEINKLYKFISNPNELINV